MALQQHDPSAASQTPVDTDLQREGTRTSKILVAMKEAVDAGDVPGFGAALASVAEIGDIHHCHQARLTAGHLVLRMPLSHGQDVIAGLYEQLLIASVDWLEENPREPSLLGHAGLLALELGSYRSAERLLDAARRLDPELPEIDKPLQQAKARRRAGVRPTHVSAGARRRLDGLKKRIEQIDAGATPDASMRISLCMIVRDEEEMLPRCLAAVAPGVDEIVIVDTGSKDRTVEIAREYGANVLFHEWTGDFGGARNIGLDAATGDWLLILDADEVLVEGDAERLHTYKAQSWREAFYLESINYTGDLDDGVAVKQAALRLMRNRPGRRYNGLVHEQIAYTLPGFLPERFAHTDVRMHHYGYLGSVREARGKDTRNLPLLLEQLAQDESDGFVHFNLGSEYVVLGEQQEALRHLRRAWELVGADDHARQLGYAPSLCSRYVRALRAAGEHEELLTVAQRAHYLFPKFTDIHFEQAMSLLDQAKFDEARVAFEDCLERGDAPDSYSATVGCGSYHAQLQLVKLELVAGDGDAAIERLRWIRSNHPGVLEAIDPLTASLLATGHEPDAVFTELTEGELSPTGWFMLAVNFQERGHLNHAERAYRGAIERRPGLGMAHVGLADLLLVRGRLDEAAEAAEHVAPDARSGGAAVRTALFARLAADDVDANRAAIEALVAGLPDSDLSDDEAVTLAAWAARRAGVGEAPPLGPEHVAVLDPLLDALLRAGAGDAFADALDLLPSTGIDGRAQHEVAATALLRRGLAEPAADAWIAAVQTYGPDADAYAGLAESARQRGLDDDARTLASEAIDLDPGHGLARRVLDALTA